MGGRTSVGASLPTESRPRSGSSVVPHVQLDADIGVNRGRLETSLRHQGFGGDPNLTAATPLEERLLRYADRCRGNGAGGCGTRVAAGFRRPRGAVRGDGTTCALAFGAGHCGAPLARRAQERVRPRGGRAGRSSRRGGSRVATSAELPTANRCARRDRPGRPLCRDRPCFLSFSAISARASRKDIGDAFSARRRRSPRSRAACADRGQQFAGHGSTGIFCSM
jgi:hypothetical protein